MKGSGRRLIRRVTPYLSSLSIKETFMNTQISSATCAHCIPWSNDCAMCGRSGTLRLQYPLYTSPGCICPPTSEKTCEAPMCPRRNPFKAVGACGTDLNRPQTT